MPWSSDITLTAGVKTVSRVHVFGSLGSIRASLNEAVASSTVQINSTPDSHCTQVDCNIVDGQLPFPYCTVWAQKAGIECTGPEDVKPGTTAKCKCDDTEVSVPLCLVSKLPVGSLVLLPRWCAWKYLGAD